MTTGTVFDAIIVGGGFGGIAAAKALLSESITNFLLIEKGHDLGGIWRENTYPGVTCDIPAALYSLKGDLPQQIVRHPEGDFHRRYLRDIASKYDLWPKIRLGTAVASLNYDDSTGYWAVTTKTGDVYTARFVIPAVGMLHIPATPQIDGQETFEGRQVHTARWDHSLDMDKNRVAVIGTGPSAVQVIPEIAQIAANVAVFQRSAGWVLPLKGRRDFSVFTTAAFRRWPVLQIAYRNLVLYGSSIVLSPIASRGWSSRPLQWWAKLYLRQQVRDRELRQKLTPTHPLGCKRIIVEREYYKTIQRENVELVTDQIVQITPTGIVTADDTAHEVDVIVYASGFDTSEFLQAIEVTGQQGLDLKEWINEHKLSYLGMVTPHFPGLLTVHNYHSFTASGSNIFMAEAQSRAAARAIRWCLDQETNCTLEVRPDVMGAYEEFLHNALDGTVYWACGNWYRDHEGRVINIWPKSPLAFQRATEKDPQDVFTLLPVPR